MAFFPMTQFDFPNATYFDSNLREILYKIKELVSNYNEIVEQFNAIENEFKSFKEQMDNLPTTISAEVAAQLTEQLPPIYTYLDDKLSIMRDDITAIGNMVDDFATSFALSLSNLDLAYKAGDSALDAKFSGLLNDMAIDYNRQIGLLRDDIYNLQWELPKVYNIVKGTYDSITKVLYDVYDSLRVHAITCGDYDSLALSCEGYDNIGLTTIQYDVESGWLLKDNKLINVVTGERDDLQSILFDMMNLITGYNAISCGDYDAKELTCGDYDNLAITVFNYDYFGANIL